MRLLILQIESKVITMDNYIVIYDNLPYKIRGFTLYHAGDDFYTIILNSRMSYSCNKKTLLHELKHILKGDFIKYKNVQQLEYQAHI